ncbi:MAG: nucleotidyl transferase AbiEii/AbiGii toxin family protein [Candidatus Thermoplasmatota archaeon]|nr:nucleotidyl transferase AbiEii/AbiGii toxin family protein [Candidatus Thermoplasmatota archaeon]
MRLPIAKQLRKKTQSEVAYLQDEVVDIMYSVSDDLILHGGTAIWRCYAGKRFSEDLDFYSQSFTELISVFQREIDSHGLTLSKLKDTGNVIFSNVSNGSVSVKVKINHVSDVSGTQMPYELADGSSIEILSLTPDQFIKEKILAYSNRRYIRDLYDIYHLVNSSDLLETTRQELMEFMENLQPPADEHVLKTIVYSGLPPSLDNLKRGIMSGIR